jgi:hypothetical protein
MYTLDFETIKQVMQEHQKTGLLYADVPAGVVSLREPCRIEIKIMAGAVVSCTIIGSSGARLTGKKATDELSRLGRLYWIFTPQQEAVTRPLSEVSPVLPPKKDSFFPRRTVFLEQNQMRTWSRMHRAVFALADGTKSVKKIAEMLSTSPDLVSKALQDLQAIGVIAPEPYNGQGRP